MLETALAKASSRLIGRSISIFMGLLVLAGSFSPAAFAARSTGAGVRKAVPGIPRTVRSRGLLKCVTTMKANKVNALFAKDLEVLLDGSSIELRRGGRTALKGVSFGQRLSRDELSGRCLFYGGNDIDKLAKDGDKVVCSDGTELTGGICGIGERHLLIRDKRKRTLAVELQSISEIKTDRIFDFKIPLSPVAGLDITGDEPLVCKTGDASFFQEPIKPATLVEIKTLLDAAGPDLNLQGDETPLICIPTGFAANSDAAILPVRIAVVRRTETEEFPYTPGDWTILPETEEKKEAEWKAPVKGTGGKTEEVLIAQLRKLASIRIPIPQEVLLGLELDPKPALLPKNPAPGVKIKIGPVRKAKKKLKIDNKPGKKGGAGQPGNLGNPVIAKAPPGRLVLPRSRRVDQFRTTELKTVFDDAFDDFDLNKDGFISKPETVKLINKHRFTGRKAQLLGVLNREMDLLQGLSNDEYGLENDGVTRKDIDVFNGLPEGDPTVRAIQRQITSQGRNLALAVTSELLPEGTDSVNPRAARQGNIGNCYFFASISSLAAMNPESIVSMIEDTGVNSDGVRVYKVTFPGEHPVLVTEPNETELSIFAPGTRDGVWVPVLEKAYGLILERASDAVVDYGMDPTGTFREEVRVTLPQDYTDGGSFLAAGVKLLTGGGSNIEETQLHTEDHMHSMLVDAFDNDKPVTAGLSNRRLVYMPFKPSPSDVGTEIQHDYGVIAYDRNTRTITLFNPLTTEPNADWVDNGTDERGIANFSDGVFSMPLSNFLDYFSDLRFAEESAASHDDDNPSDTRQTRASAGSTDKLAYADIDHKLAYAKPDNKVEKQPMNVGEAVKTGQCTFEAWGPDGVDTLHMFVKLTNCTASPLQVVKPAYMCYLSSSGSYQNMINTEDPPLSIAPGKSLQLEIPTVCASTKTVKPPPAKGSKVQYRIGDYPDPELFKKLVRILKTSKKMSQSKVYTTLPIDPKIRDRKVAQLAIWKVLGDMSDNPEDKVTRKSLEKDLLDEMNRAKLSHKQQHAIDTFSADLYHAILETIKRAL
ncbi:MAG: C2 family cysteine protease [Candidatus Obscuribacterales bacterium]